MQRRSTVSVSEGRRFGSILVAFAVVLLALVLLLTTPAQGQQPSGSGPPAGTQATGTNPDSPSSPPDLITIRAENCTVSEGASVTLEDDEGETPARFVDGQKGIEITATENQIEIEGPNNQFIGDSATLPDPNDTSFSTNGNYTVAASTGITCKDAGGGGGNNNTNNNGRAVARGAADHQYGKAEVIVKSIPNKGTLANTGGMPLAGVTFLALALVGLGISVLRFAIRRDP